MLGVSALLLDHFNDYSTDQIKDLLATIHKTVQKSYNLLEDTLLWASIQSEKINYSPILTDISVYLAEIIDIFEPVAEIKSIKLENKTKKVVNAYVDIYMFKAIVRNLISNAIKFTKRQGKIELTASQSGSTIVVKVKDNGIGMRQEAIDKLFHFSYSHTTVGTANEIGTGLGLMLCKEFVDKHNGTIWVESEIDKGTTVSVSLPLPE